MSWFKLSTKVVTFAVVYLILIYTTVYAFGIDDSDDFVVMMPSMAITDTEITPEDVNASMELGSGIIGALIGAGVGIVAGLLIISMVGAPLGIALGLGVVGAGAFIGAEIMYNIDWFAHQANLTMPWDDFAAGVKMFFGGIFDVLVFLSGFITFDLSNRVMAGGMHSSLVWIPFLMTFPVWLYFLVVLTGYAIEGAKAIKLW